MQTHFDNSRQLREHIAELTGGRAIISFSRGKDAIAAWLACREHFDTITAYYLQMLPDELLDIERESLDYYRDFFDCDIQTLMHPGTWRELSQGLVFQPPERVEFWCEYPVVEYKYPDIYNWARCSNPGAYVGVGVRSADSPMRMVSIRTHGPVKHSEGQFFPVYDWKVDDVERAIVESGIKLPVDYRLFGRTIDGIDYRFIAPLKKHYPHDYERIREWYPIVDAELIRRELYASKTETAR